MKRSLKAIISRVLRPALNELSERLDAQSLALRTLNESSRAAAESLGTIAAQTSSERALRGILSSHALAIWRGDLSGRAELIDGTPVADLTRKYREELAFWVRVSRDPEQYPSWTGTFPFVFGGWQQDRNDELASWLELSPEQFAAWARRTRAIEIGSGPYPFLARTPWAWSIAVDPLAEGYLAEGLVLPECKGVAFLASTGERIPLPTACADLLVIENCLDHVDDPIAVLKEMHRLLRPGGLVWLLVDLMEYRDEMHPNPFNEGRLREALANAGFAMIKHRISTENKSHPMAEAEFRALLVRDHPEGPRRQPKKWGAEVIPTLTLPPQQDEITSPGVASDVAPSRA